MVEIGMVITVKERSPGEVWLMDPWPRMAFSSSGTLNGLPPS